MSQLCNTTQGVQRAWGVAIRNRRGEGRGNDGGNLWTRPLLSDTAGGGDCPPSLMGFCLTPPPTHPHQKTFPPEKMKLIKGAELGRRF